MFTSHEADPSGQGCTQPLRLAWSLAGRGRVGAAAATYGAGQAPQQARGSQTGVGKAIAQGLAGAAVMGAGFHLGRRLVGGILDALFNRRG